MGILDFIDFEHFFQTLKHKEVIESHPEDLIL